MQIHLDLVGGLAGDMFIATLLDAFPEHRAGVLATIAALDLGPGVHCQLTSHTDGVLQGSRFDVRGPVEPADHDGEPANDHSHSHSHDHTHSPTDQHPHDHAPAHPDHQAGHRTGDHSHGHDHAHRAHGSWRAVQARLNAAQLPEPVRAHALGIFGVLAEGEARVHGVPVEDVAFHEVGAWDSIADIVGAAYLIATLRASRWSASAVPLGGGRVLTAHGIMPVPAPATALLLEGFAVLDDGIAGERVTPTGAAILRYLCPPRAPTRPAAPRTLARTGIGFGTRRLAGISNCVRVLAFDTATASLQTHRQLAVVEFEVDDQSAEDLATGLERMRANGAVLDVIQAPVFGKKGRMMTHVRLLTLPAELDEVIEACFCETTTIGLRYRLVDSIALPRSSAEVAVDGVTVRVKRVARPGGPTVKAEADDLAVHPGQARRSAVRARAEGDALRHRIEENDA